MPKQLTTTEFIERAHAVHGQRYDYSKSLYFNTKTKVSIICIQHGVFQQVPNDHLSGRGCRRCTPKSRSKTNKKLNTEEFINRAKLIHGEKYDYSYSVYKGLRKKIAINCLTHGVFEQYAGAHLAGKNCNKCYNRGLPPTDYLNKALEVHGNKYDYSETVFGNSKTRIDILCPLHGAFKQVTTHHLNGSGCPKCGIDLIYKQKAWTAKTFVVAAKAMHGDKYDYTFVAYVNQHTKVKIMCPYHGFFEQKPMGHIKGNGCKKCQKSISEILCLKKAKSDLKATLYIVRIYNKIESFYKVGITFKSIKSRLQNNYIKGYKYNVIAELNQDANYVFEWEQSILYSFAYISYEPLKRFHGWTECFSEVTPILAALPLGTRFY